MSERYSATFGFARESLKSPGYPKGPPLGHAHALRRPGHVSREQLFVGGRAAAIYRLKIVAPC